MPREDSFRNWFNELDLGGPPGLTIGKSEQCFKTPGVPLKQALPIKPIYSIQGDNYLDTQLNGCL